MSIKHNLGAICDYAVDNAYIIHPREFFTILPQAASGDCDSTVLFGRMNW